MGGNVGSRLPCIVSELQGKYSTFTTTSEVCQGFFPGICLEFHPNSLEFITIFE
jgi:hypothetical protein